MITRRLFLASLAAAPPRRPNVVVFMTDDHGAWATGTYGCGEMVTPNVDALAKAGVRFTRAFACTPVCSPSRVTYITGRIPSTHGVQDWLRPEDSFGPTAKRWLDGHLTYTELLAKAGYQCGMVGKWHMGEDERAQRGFSYWATVPGGGGTFKNAEFVKNGETKVMPGFKEDAIGDFALEFLEQQKGDQPFYLHVPFYAPHTPYDFQPEGDRKPYENSTFGCFPDEPEHPSRNYGQRNLQKNQAAKKGYSALITGMDRNVGRILRRLEERGWRENTLVVFTADQGWNAGHHGVWGKGNGTWPFNMYEESIRVPMIWSHPARLRAGQVTTEMVSSYDFFPTILDYVGVAAPVDRRRPGRSYVPLLEGKRVAWRDRLFFEYSNVRGVRTGRYKLVLRTKEWPSELYDLEKDPDERVNRFADVALSAVQKALTTELEGFFKGQGAPPLEQWRGTTKQNLTKYSSTGPVKE
jgi:choline-sulfatase